MDSLRWRRQRRFLLLYGGGIIGVTALFGGRRLSAITSGSTAPGGPDDRFAIQGRAPLFDDSVIHEVDLGFDDAEYRAMIATFQAENEKVTIEARVTIDGTEVSQVGVRLKGNSTLFSLRGAGGPGAAGRPGGPGVGPGPGRAPGPGPGVPGGGIPVDVDDPGGMPWLIRFDDPVNGQTYQGFAEVAVRPTSTSVTTLNEAVSLRMVGVAGEPTQRFSYAAFSVNGGERRLRLLVEAPAEAYVSSNFTTPGVLYKAESSGRFAYRDDDPLSYDLVFSQVTRNNQYDLKPVIDLMRWEDGASDAAFVEELGERVDVERLATYVALQDLLANTDDMSGPGQNYYLWWDLAEERFVVLSWDMNLALRAPIGAGGIPPNSLRGNPLKDRFVAAVPFAEVRATARGRVFEALYGDGAAERELERLASVVRAAGLVEGAMVEQEAAHVRATIEAVVAAGG